MVGIDIVHNIGLTRQVDDDTITRYCLVGYWSTGCCCPSRKRPNNQTPNRNYSWSPTSHHLNRDSEPSPNQDEVHSIRPWMGVPRRLSTSYRKMSPVCLTSVCVLYVLRRLRNSVSGLVTVQTGIRWPVTFSKPLRAVVAPSHCEL